MAERGDWSSRSQACFRHVLEGAAGVAVGPEAAEAAQRVVPEEGAGGADAQHERHAAVAHLLAGREAVVDVAEDSPRRRLVDDAQQRHPVVGVVAQQVQRVGPAGQPDVGARVGRRRAKMPPPLWSGPAATRMFNVSHTSDA